MQNKKIAVFFDCENVSADYVPSILEKLTDYGEIMINQSFKNWESQNNKAWNKELHNKYAIQPINVMTSCNYKNSSDISITINIMETVLFLQKDIDIIVIVSSDSDFKELAIKVKSYGKKVIGFGEEKTSDSLRAVYSEFIELPIKKDLNRVKDDEVINLLKKTIKLLTAAEDYCSVAKLGEYLKNQEIPITAKEYGANRWGDIIKKYPNIFNFTHSDSKKSTAIVSLKN